MVKRRKAVRRKGGFRPDTPSDLGTPELAAKTTNEVKLTQDNRRRRRILVQQPIDFYLNMRSGGINMRQWEAGNKLFEYFSMSQIIPSPTALTDKVRIPSTGPNHGSMTQQHAYAEYRAAIKAMGPQLIGTGLVLHVCCYGYYLRDLRVPYYRTPNQMMACLQETLDLLGDHFSIPRYPITDKH